MLDKRIEVILIFIDGSLGDTIYSISHIDQIHKNTIIFVSKRIGKDILSIYLKNKFSIYLPIGGYFFRKIVYFVLLSLPLISRFLKIQICIFNNKGLIYKTYMLKKKVQIIRKILIVHSRVESHESVKDSIGNGNTGYGKYILVNMDVDESVRKKTVKNAIRPTKLPTVYFFEELILDLKKQLPSYKFIQIGEGGAAISNVDINLVGKTNLIELAQLIRYAKFTITIEGGIRAFCLFLDAPAVAIFGPTSQNILPSSQRVRDVRYHSCPPCWRNKKEWYSKCDQNNGGEALCTSDMTLLPQIRNLSLLIQNELY